jgi:hypothetical protein
MQTIRIHFQDLTSVDVQFSDSQAEEFIGWLRFANQNATYAIPSEEKEIKRKDIARIEKV